MECAICEKTIEAGDEVEPLNGAFVHTDCLTDEFSKEIDEHPLCNPVRRNRP